MQALKQYTIPLSGLAEGQYIYDFEVNDRFFEQFAESEVKSGTANCHVLLNKTASLIILNISINGSIRINCDRCLDDFEHPVSYKGTVYVKFDERDSYEDNDIIALPASDNELDMSQLFYDYIHLSLPYQRVHPDDGSGKSSCNSEMIEKLNKHLVNEYSFENTDSRWDELKNLL